LEELNIYRDGIKYFNVSIEPELILGSIFLINKTEE
jgi:hypothetical protein